MRRSPSGCDGFCSVRGDPVLAIVAGAQLLARAIVWSSFTLGFFLCLFGYAHDQEVGLIMAGCAGLASCSQPPRLGDDERSAFQAVAFKRT